MSHKPSYLPWEESWKSWEPGDRLQFRRRGYTHWGIYEGIVDGCPSLCHYATESGDFVAEPTKLTRLLDSFGGSRGLICRSDKATVRRDPVEKVAGTSQVRVNNRLDSSYQRLSEEEILNNAREMLGKGGYNLVFNNCEHFATYCRYGKKWSTQIYVGGSVLLFLAAVSVSVPIGIVFLPTLPAVGTLAVMVAGSQIVVPLTFYISEWFEGSSVDEVQLPSSNPPVESAKLFEILTVDSTD